MRPCEWLKLNFASCAVYCGIVVPYSAAPMCQWADALRFSHVGACLPTIWYVPVHLLPYHRGIDPSERSHWAAYCPPQRCLVRACSIYQFSIAPIGEMAPGVPCKALNRSFNCIIAPVCVRWHPSVRWHRGAQKNTRKNY